MTEPTPDKVIHKSNPQPHDDKKITLTLTWYVNYYKVVSITNTTYYKPGQWMTPEVAEMCCKLKNWEVVMTDNQVLQTLFNIGASHITPFNLSV